MRSRNPHARETGRNVLVRCGFQSQNVTGQSGKPFRNETALTSEQYPRKGTTGTRETCSDQRKCKSQSVTGDMRTQPQRVNVPRLSDQRFYLTEHAS